MYICMYIYVCVYMYMYIYICMYVCKIRPTGSRRGGPNDIMVVISCRPLASAASQMGLPRCSKCAL